MESRSLVVGLLIQWCIAAALVAADPAALGRLAASGNHIAGALAAGIALYCILAGRGFRLGRIARAAVLPMLGTGLVVSLTAIAEETIWRGFAFGFLADRSGVPVAVVMTTLGFAALHMYGQGWSGVISHVLTGAAFALAVVITGGLIAAMLMHVTYNLAVVAARADSNAGARA
jgi:membrane protease YdiL (CAAX protease family)